MRKLKRILTLLLTLLVCFSVMAVPVFAEDAVSVRLDVELVTDKESYQANEPITATLRVTNPNKFDVTDLSLEQMVPDGYTLSASSAAKKQLDTLAAGEAAELSVTFEKLATSSSPTPVPSQSPAGSVTATAATVQTPAATPAATPQSTAAPTGLSVPETGDSGIGVWICLMAVAVAGIGIVLVFKKKNTGRILSLFLAFSILGSLFSATGIEVKAESVSNRMDADTVVILDGCAQKLQAFVTFSADVSGVTCSVSFDSNGGSTVQAQEIPYGSNITMPETPEKDGFAFAGWYDADGALFDASLPVTEDVQLKAEWLPLITTQGDGFEEILDGLSQDTGDSATPDGEVSHTIQSNPDSPITSVDVNYHLDQGGSVTVREVVSNPMLSTAGLVGIPVEINAWGANVTNATITFHYDVSRLPSGTNPADLAVVWYDEENDIVTLMDGCTVDTANQTVSIPTTHFSKYGVVLRQLWDAAWGKELPPVRTESVPYYNVILAMDRSDSMQGDKMQQSIQAAQNFVDVLTDNDLLTVISFNSSSSVLFSQIPLASNPDDPGSNPRLQVKNEIASISATGGTSIQSALLRALNYVESDTQHQPLIVLTSDGQSSVSDSTLTQLQEAGVKVVAVGIGTDVDADLMQKIADSTGGSYLYCEDASDIADAFIDLQNLYIGSTKDSDGDGLPDLVETSGMRDQYGEIWTTDPNNPDTDGDGYSDGEEMGEYYPLSSQTHFKRVSRPDLYTVHSDEAYLMMPETMFYDITEDNKLVLTTYVVNAPYRMVPDLLTPVEADGIPKEYLYAQPRNLQVEILDPPSVFHLESINTVEESTYGTATTFKTTAVFSFTETSEWQTFVWRVTADNCSEWSGYTQNGILATYIEQEQTVLPSTKPADPNQKIDRTVSEMRSNAQMLLATPAKEFLSDLASVAKQSDKELAEDSETSLKNIKKAFPSTSTSKVPDEVYQAIAMAVLDATNASIVEEYDPDKLTQQVAGQILGGLQKLDTEIVVNGTTYEIKGSIWAMSGVNVSFMTVTYSGRQIQLTSTSSQKEVAAALSNYCAVLAKLNNEVWKDFVACYISDTFGLAGIKNVTKGNAEKVLDVSEDVILAICDRDYANKLIENLGETAKKELESNLFSNKFKKFIAAAIPNGEKFVEAAEKFKKANDQLTKYLKQLDEYAQLLKDAASEEKTAKAEAKRDMAYNELVTLCDDFINSVAGL